MSALMKLIEKTRKDRDETLAAAEVFLERMAGGEELPPADAIVLAELQASAKTANDRIEVMTVQASEQLAAQQRDALYDGQAAAVKETVGASLQVREPDLSLGELFTRSDAYQAYRKTKSGSSGVVDIDFALIKSTDANGKPFAGVWRARDAATGTHSTPLLDACGFEPVGSGSFEYIQWGTANPEAGVVAEGATKPEATVTPVLMPGQLDKVAHHLPLSQEVLEDFPRMEAMVSGALIRGVRDKAEALAAAALVAASLQGIAKPTLLAAIRYGIAETQKAGFRSTAVVVNPTDYATIDVDLLTSTLNGARRESPVWGLTVVSAGAVAEGTAYVGDLMAGVTVFARQQVQLRMTDSHASEFTSNILRVLAEQRIKTIVTQPAALVRCTVAPETATEPEPETSRRK